MINYLLKLLTHFFNNKFKNFTFCLFGKEINRCLRIKPPNFEISDSVLIKIYDICNKEEKKFKLN